VYYNVPIDGIVESGAIFNATFSYTKSDSVLSSNQTPVQPVRTAAGDATALSSGLLTTNSTIWVVAAAGLILVVLGLVWFFQQQKVNPAAASASRHRHSSTYPVRAKATTVSSTAAATTVYCHQCGKRAGPGDAFCRSCGVKLRTD
jgi:hypothetical protein